MAAADAEERMIALKNRSKRSDLSTQQAREAVQRSIATEPLAARIRTYNATLDRSGLGEGIGFFDQVVIPFVEHLVRIGEKREALNAAQRAQRTLKVEPGSQLESEMAKLLATLKK